jgi:hypothetical protein
MEGSLKELYAFGLTSGSPNRRPINCTVRCEMLGNRCRPGLTQCRLDGRMFNG